MFAIFGTWLLARTQFGNWIFAVGGNKEAARAEGVPAARTKTTLFMLVSGAAWLSGMLIAFRLTSVQADLGNGQEFEYIIAAVVGGNLLTGGYGSAAGGAIGSLIMSMSTQGIPFAGWNSNWRFLFLGRDPPVGRGRQQLRPPQGRAVPMTAQSVVTPMPLPSRRPS